MWRLVVCSVRRAISLWLLLAVSSVSVQATERVKFLSTQNINELEQILAADSTVPRSASSTVRIEHLAQDIRFKFKVRGVGRVEATLTKRRFFNLATNRSAFLQGESVTLSGSPLSGASFATLSKGDNGQYELRLFAVGSARKNTRKSWRGIFEVKATLQAEDSQLKIKSASLHRSKRSSGDKLGCLEGAKLESNHSLSTLAGPSTTAQVQIAKILLEADLEYVNQISDSMQTELATIINGVDTIYQRDLGLSFDVTIASQATAYTAPIQYDENYDLLLHNEMAIAQPASSRGSDIHFLFTGKTPVGDDLANLAGVVPQIGAVCKTPEKSIGITIRINTATDTVVTAHEIGHLYGGEHDDAFTDPNNPNIMSSVVSDTITSFSSYSMNQIGTFVGANGSCLVTGERDGGGGGNDDGVSDSLPATAVLYAFKERGYFALEMYDSADDSVFSSYSVDVLYRKKQSGIYRVIRTLITDEDGVAYFRPRKRGFYIFEVAGRRSRRLRLK